MPRLLTRWALDESYNDASYDDSIPVLLNICELNDSSNNKSNKCDNVKKNQYWRDKGV